MKPFSPLLIWSSLLTGFVLSLMPFGSALSALLPPIEWLVLVYWSLMDPRKSYFFAAVVFGVLQDVNAQQLLGATALLYVLTTYVAVRLQADMIRLTPYQQLPVIAVLILLYQLGQLIVFGAIDDHLYWYFWLSPLTALLLWPLVFTVLHQLNLMRHGRMR